MNAIGYIRVSRVGGREGDSFLSPELQRLSIERVCAREGFALLDTVTELDRSGGDAGRPLWNSCIERIERGEAQALVVWNLDRFSRSIVDGFTAIERIEAAGGRLVSEDGATSTLDRGIRLVLAQEYREQVKKGWRRAQASAVERGVAVASKIPLGYTRGVDRRYVVDPATAPAVREAFEMRAQGVSWPRIASYVRGATGRNTNPQAARDVVRNRTYLGDVHYGGMVNEGAHEAIVTRKLYDEANAVRGAKRQGDGTLTASMLLDPTCATCGRRMQATRSRAPGPCAPPGEGPRGVPRLLGRRRERADRHRPSAHPRGRGRHEAPPSQHGHQLRSLQGGGGWAERREWLDRMLKAVVVSRGRQPLSQRCEVELR